MITLTPLSAGAVKGTVTDVAEAIGGVPIVGAPGATAETVDAEALDGSDVPALFVAVTVNVYEVPAVRPETVIGEEVPVPVNPPGLEVTV